MCNVPFALSFTTSIYFILSVQRLRSFPWKDTPRSLGKLKYYTNSLIRKTFKSLKHLFDLTSVWDIDINDRGDERKRIRSRENLAENLIPDESEKRGVVLAGTVQVQGSKKPRGPNGQGTAQAVGDLLSLSHQLNNSHGATSPWKAILNVYKKNGQLFLPPL